MENYGEQDCSASYEDGITNILQSDLELRPEELTHSSDEANVVGEEAICEPISDEIVQENVNFLACLDEECMEESIVYVFDEPVVELNLSESNYILEEPLLYNLELSGVAMNSNDDAGSTILPEENLIASDDFSENTAVVFSENTSEIFSENATTFILPLNEENTSEVFNIFSDNLSLSDPQKTSVDNNDFKLELDLTNSDSPKTLSSETLENVDNKEKKELGSGLQGCCTLSEFTSLYGDDDLVATCTPNKTIGKDESKTNSPNLVIKTPANMLPSVLSRNKLSPLQKPVESSSTSDAKSPQADTSPSPSLRTSVLGKEQIKKRLQSFSLFKQGIQPIPIKKIVNQTKQSKIQTQIIESYDETGKKLIDKLVITKKPPKQGTNAQDKARTVIEEIEQIKREEACRLEQHMAMKHDFTIAGRDMRKYRRKRKSESSDAESKHSERKSTSKERKYSKDNKDRRRRSSENDNKTDKKKSEDERTDKRKSEDEKRKSEERKKSEDDKSERRKSESDRNDRNKIDDEKLEESKLEVMPQSWNEIKKKNIDVEVISKMKEKMFKFTEESLKNQEKIDRKSTDKRSQESDKLISYKKEDYLKPQLMFEFPSLPRRPVIALSVEGSSKYYPPEIIRFTEKIPCVSYCENPKWANDLYRTRKQVLSEIPKDRMETVQQIIENKLRSKDDHHIVQKGNWYPKNDYLIDYKSYSKIIEPVTSYGLSVLSQMYDDNDDQETDDEHKTSKKDKEKSKEIRKEEEPKKEKEKTYNKSKKKESKSRSRSKSKEKTKHDNSPDKKSKKPKKTSKDRKESKTKSRSRSRSGDNSIVEMPVKDNVDELSENKTPNTEEYRSNWESDEDMLNEIMPFPKGFSRSNSLDKNWESDEEMFPKFDEKRKPDDNKKRNRRSSEQRDRNNSEETNRRRYEEDKRKYKNHETDFDDKYSLKNRRGDIEDKSRHNSEYEHRKSIERLRLTPDFDHKKLRDFRHENEKLEFENRRIVDYKKTNEDKYRNIDYEQRRNYSEFNIERKRSVEAKHDVEEKSRTDNLPYNKWSSEEDIHNKRKNLNESKSEKRDVRCKSPNYRRSQWSSEDEFEKRKNLIDLNSDKKLKRRNRWEDEKKELISLTKEYEKKKELLDKYQEEEKRTSKKNNKKMREEKKRERSMEKSKDKKNKRKSKDKKNKTKEKKLKSKDKKPKVQINYSDLEEEIHNEQNLFASNNKPKIKIDYADFDVSLIEMKDNYNKKYEENKIRTPERKTLKLDISNILEDSKNLESQNDDLQLTISKIDVDDSTNSPSDDGKISVEVPIVDNNVPIVGITPVAPPTPIPKPAHSVPQDTTSKLVSEYEEFMKAVCFDDSSKDNEKFENDASTTPPLTQDTEASIKVKTKAEKKLFKESSSHENSSDNDSVEHNSDSDDSSEEYSSSPKSPNTIREIVSKIKTEILSDEEPTSKTDKRKRSSDSSTEELEENKVFNPDIVIKTEKINDSSAKKQKLNDDWECTRSQLRYPIIDVAEIMLPTMLPEDIPLPSDDISMPSTKDAPATVSETPTPLKKSRSFIPIKLLTAESRAQANDSSKLVDNEESLSFGKVTPKDLLEKLEETEENAEESEQNSRKSQWNLNISSPKKQLLQASFDQDSDEDFTDKFIKQVDKKPQQDTTKPESKDKTEHLPKTVETSTSETKDAKKSDTHRSKSKESDKSSSKSSEKRDDKRSDRRSPSPKRARRTSRDRNEAKREDRPKDTKDKRRLSDRRSTDRRQSYTRDRTRYSREKELNTRSRDRERFSSKKRDRSRDRSRDRLRSYHRDDPRRYSRSPSRKDNRLSLENIPIPVRMDDTDFSTTNMDIAQSPINSPLSGFKRSLADSTISDSELLQQLNTPDESNEPSPRYTQNQNQPYYPSPCSPKRISLDDRINLVLGIEKEPPKSIDTVCTRGPYTNTPLPYHDYGYDNNYGPLNDGYYGNYQQTGYYPNQMQQPASDKLVQVGNVIQVVPSEQPPVSVKQNEVVQVGNMLQIVPMTNIETVTTITTAAAPPPPIVNNPVIVVGDKPVAKPIDQMILERRVEKEKRRQEREQRRKEKEKKRKEREKRRQMKTKVKTENMIKRALMLETGEGDLDLENLEDETEMNTEQNASTPLAWPPPVTNPIVSLPKPPAKGILIAHGFREKLEISVETIETKKIVKFADGICPGEGTSPSGGEELPSPPPPPRKLPKEKRYKRIKNNKQHKKKIKVKIIRTQQQQQQQAAAPLDDDDDDEDDNLPPPPPPPGSPPPHLWPPRIKQAPINNIHPSLPATVFPPNPFPPPPPPLGGNNGPPPNAAAPIMYPAAFPPPGAPPPVMGHVPPPPPPQGPPLQQQRHLHPQVIPVMQPHVAPISGAPPPPPPHHGAPPALSGPFHH